jgi:hypothetical protein
VLWIMAIILKAHKVNLFVSSVLFVFWYHSTNFSDTPHICDISWLTVNCVIQIKQSHYRPWQALRVPGVGGSQILSEAAHAGGKVVSLTHRPPVPPRHIAGTGFD